MILGGLLWLGGCSSGREVPAGALIEVQDEQGHPLTLRVDSVEPDPLDAEGEIALYGVSVQREGAWVPYCSPDRFGSALAVPIAGGWSPRGDFIASDKLTLACTSGAIGKCVRMGYVPWRELDAVSLAPYHTACVRMLRADYCGDGRPHTVDGTWIDTWDKLGIQLREPDRPALFEAGWSENGATFVERPRWSDDLTALVAECPDKLAGRTALDGSRTLEEIGRDFPETLLYVEHAANASDRLRAPEGPLLPAHR